MTGEQCYLSARILLQHVRPGGLEGHRSQEEGTEPLLSGNGEHWGETLLTSSLHYLLSGQKDDQLQQGFIPMKGERKNREKQSNIILLFLCFDLQHFSPETQIVLNISYNKHKAYQLLQVINQIYWPMTEYWSLLLANESSVFVSRGCYQSLPPAHYCPPILGNNIITTIHCQQNSYLQLYMWRCLALRSAPSCW